MFEKQLQISAVKRVLAGFFNSVMLWVMLIACQDDLPNVKFYDGELRIALHCY